MKASAQRMKGHLGMTSQRALPRPAVADRKGSRCVLRRGGRRLQGALPYKTGHRHRHRRRAALGTLRIGGLDRFPIRWRRARPEGAERAEKLRLQ